MGIFCGDYCIILYNGALNIHFQPAWVKSVDMDGLRSLIIDIGVDRTILVTQDQSL